MSSLYVITLLSLKKSGARKLLLSVSISRSTNSLQTDYKQTRHVYSRIHCYSPLFSCHVLFLLVLHQLQIMGFNTDLYKNMTEASKRPHGLVSISLLIQVRFLYHNLILLFLLCSIMKKDTSEELADKKKSNSNIRNPHSFKNKTSSY